MSEPNATEAIFQDHVLQIARMNGWLVHHATPHKVGNTWRSDGKGTPDLILVHRQRGLIFAELKTERGKLSHDQQQWALALQPWAEYYVWRPNQLELIAKRLGGANNGAKTI